MPAVVLVLLASLLFGTTGTAQAFGPDAGVFSIGAARILIGGGALAVVAILLGRRSRSSPPLGAPMGALAGAGIVLVGGIGVIAYQPAFFLGTSANGVATGTLVALGSAPILTGALGWIIERRFPGLRWAAATAIAAIGLALLGAASGVAGDAAAAGAGATASVDPVGILGSLGAGLAYAVYTLASKRLLDAGWTSPTAMGAVFGAAAVLAVPLLLASDTGWLGTGPGIAMALWLGLGTVAAAYLLFGAGLRSLPAPTVSTLTLAEPLTATLLGILVLGERLEPLAWAGVGAIVVGILVLVLAPRTRVASTAGTAA